MTLYLCTEMVTISSRGFSIRETIILLKNVASTYQFITDTLPKSETSPHSHIKSHVHFFYFLSIYPLLENFPNQFEFFPDFG